MTMHVWQQLNRRHKYASRKENTGQGRNSERGGREEETKGRCPPASEGVSHTCVTLSSCKGNGGERGVVEAEAARQWPVHCANRRL